MRKLSVFIEINGESVYVGEIAGKDSTDEKMCLAIKVGLRHYN